MKQRNEEVKHKEITRDEFLSEFGSLDEKANLDRLKTALQTALDIRKFEIGLYWQRATYFWAFIAAAFVAFGALIPKANTDAPHYGLQEMMAVLGLILSIAWWYVNKGSTGQC